MNATLTVPLPVSTGVSSVLDGPVIPKPSFPGPDSLISTTKYVGLSLTGLYKAGPSTFTIVS